MTVGQWRKIQISIKKYFSNGNILALDSILESHKGAFLALFDKNGNLVQESKVLKDGLKNLHETINELCESINKEELNFSSVQLCIIREVSYIKNPLDWEIEHDGVCFQWGNKFKAFYMPYEIVKINGDKVTVLDKLCCHKCNCPSSLWKMPEGLVFKIIVDWHK